jgi:hypothetical protein
MNPVVEQCFHVAPGHIRKYGTNLNQNNLYNLLVSLWGVCLQQYYRHRCFAELKRVRDSCFCPRSIDNVVCGLCDAPSAGGVSASNLTLHVY